MNLKETVSLFLISILCLLAGCSSSHNSANSGPQKVLLVSFDGFMNEYLDRNPTPHFDRFIDGGVKAEHLIPVFPTKTFPNHYSQVTGLRVENHGIIANSFPDDSLGGRFSFGPPEDSPNDERWWGGEPIWTTVEKQGKTAATMFWPGSEASINGIRPTKWKPYDGTVDNYARVDSVMAWLDPAGEVNADFATLYFSDVDSRGHSYGPNSPEVGQAVISADSLVGYIWDKIEMLGLSDELNVIIVSDHGMAELSEEKLIFLEELVNTDSFEFVDRSPVAMLKPNEGMTNELYRTLKNNEKNYRVFLRDELPAEYGFSDHYRIPEIIMIADVSYTITSRDYFERRGIPAGMHGYDHTAPEMATIFMAAGPAFKSTGEITPPISALDLYELMSFILELEPAENDGELQRYLLKDNR